MEKCSSNKTKGSYCDCDDKETEKFVGKNIFCSIFNDILKIIILKENLGGKDYKPIYAYDIEEATPGLIKITRTTIVVRNAGCARSSTL